MDIGSVKNLHRVQPDFQRSARRRIDLAKDPTLPASKAVRDRSSLQPDTPNSKLSLLRADPSFRDELAPRLFRSLRGTGRSSPEGVTAYPAYSMRRFRSVPYSSILPNPGPLRKRC